MSADSQQIASLLRAGLDAYGVDDVEGALEAWNAVLALDPGNADARDYIESLEATPVGQSDASEAVLGASADDALEEAAALAAEGRELAAFALLEATLEDAPLDLETLAVVEIVRARLLPVFRAGFGVDATPRATGDRSQLAGLGLSDTTCAVHGACDGSATVASLPSACGLDPFDTFHHLSVLVDAGLVRVYA